MAFTACGLIIISLADHRSGCPRSDLSARSNRRDRSYRQGKEPFPYVDPRPRRRRTLDQAMSLATEWHLPTGRSGREIDRTRGLRCSALVPIAGVRWFLRLPDREPSRRHRARLISSAHGHRRVTVTNERTRV